MIDDNSLMSFGRHKGEKLANVPAEYLLAFYERNKRGKKLRAYILENMEVLEQEVKNSKQPIADPGTVTGNDE